MPGKVVKKCICLFAIMNNKYVKCSHCKLRSFGRFPQKTARCNAFSLNTLGVEPLLFKVMVIHERSLHDDRDSDVKSERRYVSIIYKMSFINNKM